MPDGVLLQAGLQGRSKALSLPLRGYHEGYFGEVRRRVQEVAGTAHNLAFARPGHGQEGDLGLVVDVAQRLRLRIGERTGPPEEPRVDLVWRETVKLRLQSARGNDTGQHAWADLWHALRRRLALSSCSASVCSHMMAAIALYLVQCECRRFLHFFEASSAFVENSGLGCVGAVHVDENLVCLVFTHVVWGRKLKFFY